MYVYTGMAKLRSDESLRGIFVLSPGTPVEPPSNTCGMVGTWHATFTSCQDVQSLESDP